MWTLLDGEMCQKSRLLLLLHKCAAQQGICVFLSKCSKAVMMEIFIDQAISRVYSCRLNHIHNHMDFFLRCDDLRASGLKSKRPHPSWHLDKIHRRAINIWLDRRYVVSPGQAIIFSPDLFNVPVIISAFSKKGLHLKARFRAHEMRFSTERNLDFLDL